MREPRGALEPPHPPLPTPSTGRNSPSQPCSQPSPQATQARLLSMVLKPQLHPVL